VQEATGLFCVYGARPQGANQRFERGAARASLGAKFMKNGLVARHRFSELQARHGAVGQLSGLSLLLPDVSTEISNAEIVPLFSSQCVVFLSSGQPTPARSP
jgi:hypothetical protein